MFNTPKVESNSTIKIHKVSHQEIASILEFEEQTLFMERYWSQQWCGVTQVLCSKLEMWNASIDLKWKDLAEEYPMHLQKRAPFTPIVDALGCLSW